jgi:tRNA (guanine37-N1)-methyltransferase
VGDFVVSGGELPALMVLDAALRLIPGVLNDAASFQEDSFYAGGLDHPHYTRPEMFEGEAVPAVLLSGNHMQIAKWRLAQAQALTAAIRPDLLLSPL